MSDSPLFSVVIPLYNKKAYVRRALDSVLAQSCCDYEVIVVDDGSTDGGAAVVEEYCGQRVRLLRQANGGVSSARNRGIAEARGEWVAFLDADDEWLPSFLAHISEAAAAYPDAGLCFCAHHKSRPVFDEGLPLTAAVRIGDYYRDAYCKGRSIITGTVAVRRQCFEKVGGFPLGVKVGEDHDLWLRVVWHFPVVYIPRVLAIYHIENSSSDWMRSVDRPCWHSTYQRYRDNGSLSENVVRAFDRIYDLDSVNYALTLRRNLGLGAALRALTERPWNHLCVLTRRPRWALQLVSPRAFAGLSALKRRWRSAEQQAESMQTKRSDAS